MGGQQLLTQSDSFDRFSLMKKFEFQRWDTFRNVNRRAKRTSKIKRLKDLEKQGPWREVWGLPHWGALVSGRDQLHFLGPSSLLFSYFLPKQL